MPRLFVCHILAEDVYSFLFHKNSEAAIIWLVLLFQGRQEIHHRVGLSFLCLCNRYQNRCEIETCCVLCTRFQCWRDISCIFSLRSQFYDVTRQVRDTATAVCIYCIIFRGKWDLPMREKGYLCLIGCRMFCPSIVYALGLSRQPCFANSLKGTRTYHRCDLLWLHQILW